MMSIARTNPFEYVYKMCNRGGSRERLANLPDFPTHLDVELTNACNFRCLMCPTGTGSSTRARGFMSEQTFQLILDQAGPRKTPIRFVRWGEPTLHPHFVTWTRVLHDAGLLCHLNTNGLLFDEALIEALVSIPIDSIKLSFQGVDRSTYSEMRNRDFFDGLVKVLKRLHQARGERERPFLQVSTTITRETAEQVTRLREAVSPWCDAFNAGRTLLAHIDLNQVRLDPGEREVLDRLKMQESLVKTHPECCEVFDKLSINWDGTVSACCADYNNLMIAGNMRHESLEAIWKGPQMQKYRELLVDMRHDELPLCQNCYDTHGLLTPGIQGL